MAMMEPNIGSSRLFAAFENVGQSPGSDFRSTLGPSGCPADSVVRVFEQAMAPPGGMIGVEASVPISASSATPPLMAPGPAGYMPAPQGALLFRADRAAWGKAPGGDSYAVAPLQERDTLLSPVELYRAQYQIGLLRAHVDLVIHSSQSVTQSLETTLKQSG